MQLRGNRSVWLFAFYLGLLITIAMIVYAETSGLDHISISQAQRQLREFYTVVMVLLAALISLVAPALTATTVVMERQRKSLDLVFSAPTSPKYFLVGKMIASYRFTWMLLILALPVTAACVTLGGASWSDVLVAYVLLSFHGLLLTSMALMMSTIAQRPVAALVWTYAVVIAYLFVTSFLAAVILFSGGSSAGAGREVFFGASLSPFFVSYSADTHSVVWGIDVPNWILAGIFCLLICRICLLTSASLLAPYGGKELASLRVHGLVYVLILALYAGYMVTSTTIMGAMMTGGGMAATAAPTLLGKVLCHFLAPLAIFVPLFTCFGYDAERRFWPNGVFNVRRILDGTPAGGLPYLLALLVLAIVGVGGGGYWASAVLPDKTFAAYAVFALGFWFFFWAVGRITSSLFLGLKTARGLQFAVFALIVLLPVPFLASVASTQSGRYSTQVWSLYVLAPIFTQEHSGFLPALAYGTGFLILGFILAVVAEKRILRRSVPKKVMDGRPLSAA